MKQVLLLNASEEVLRMIEWQKAVSLLFNNKAEPPYNYDHYYEIPHCSGVFYLSKTLRLKNYIKIPIIKTFLSRKNIHRRDNYICQYCGMILESGSATIDHILPRSRGGGNTWENLVCSCVKCNVKKGNKTPLEANMTLLSKPRQPRFINKQEVELQSIWSRWA
jgi:hypothetical protein